jgi:hypothetical protein
LHGVDELRQQEIEKLNPVKRARDVSIGAAEEDEPSNALGPLSVRFERDLAPHGMTDEDTRRIADVTAHRAEVLRVRGNVDAVGIGGKRASAMAPVVPVHDGHEVRQSGPQVFPNESVAEDAVAENRVHVERPVRANALPDVEARAVGASGE